MVSNAHIRIHTIIYDFDSLEDVGPLVYVQDLSRNGTLWNGILIERGGGGVLLSNGDILTLSPDSYMQFRCSNETTTTDLTKLQVEESKVSLASLHLVTPLNILWTAVSG
jgi:hypothetical protein